MTQERALPVEEILDPEDWESMRALGHRMLDDMLDYLKTVRERPVWQPIPEDVRRKFHNQFILNLDEIMAHLSEHL